MIEEFLSLSDEKLLDKLDIIIQIEKLKGYEESVKPMSLIEFRDRI